MPPLNPTEYAPYYAAYIQHAGTEIWKELEDQLNGFPALIRNIPEAKSQFAYAPGKWTTKELIGHIIDTERIMAYRALRIARNDSTPLPGFDQDQYVAHSRYASRTPDSLADEFKAVRQSNLLLFKSFDDTELRRMGMASEKPVSVRALLYIIAGHLKHHVRILQERYLQTGQEQVAP